MFVSLGALFSPGAEGGERLSFSFKRGYRATLPKELHQGLKVPREVWVKLGCSGGIWISEDVLFSFFELKFNLSN